MHFKKVNDTNEQWKVSSFWPWDTSEMTHTHKKWRTVSLFSPRHTSEVGHESSQVIILEPLWVSVGWEGQDWTSSLVSPTCTQDEPNDKLLIFCQHTDNNESSTFLFAMLTILCVCVCVCLYLCVCVSVCVYMC